MFPSEEGRPAFPFRGALGALIIKEELGISGDETVLQIQENPYLQYFLGFTSYQTDVPFDGSTLVHFRKRLNWTGLATINELLVKNVKDVHDKNTPDDSCPQKPATSNAGSGSDEKTHQVPGRIVSIRQPHVRPIVRGKARLVDTSEAWIMIAMIVANLNQGYRYVLPGLLLFFVLLFVHIKEKSLRALQSSRFIKS